MIAVEKGVKGARTVRSRSCTEGAEGGAVQRLLQTFQPKAEDGESYPPESRKVTLRAADVLGDRGPVRGGVRPGGAQGPHEHEGEGRCGRRRAHHHRRCAGVAAPHLEKQITDVRTMVDSMPTLDENESGLPTRPLVPADSPAKSHKTRKVQQPIVLFPGHRAAPGPDALVSVDEIAGWWTTVKISGAIPHDEKKGIPTRCDRLLKALKQARERANDIEVDPFEVGDNIFSTCSGPDGPQPVESKLKLK